MNNPTTTIREALAAYTHDGAWSGWMRYLFSKGVFNDDGSWTMPAWAVARWLRQMQTPYADLPEEEKQSDRAEADTILAIIAAADSSVAPTAALPSADPAETSPASAGRQRYTIREFRLEAMTVDPVFVSETVSAYIEDLNPGNRYRFVQWSKNEANVIEVYSCPTLIHALACLTAIEAMDLDYQRGYEKEQHELFERVLQERRAEEQQS
jgi:hypothetical protein